MNFSEYVAILSGNTELLRKARLEKKIATLESERQAFTRGKSSSRYKLETIVHGGEKNNDLIVRISKDIGAFYTKVQTAPDGTRHNPVQLDGLQGSNPKEVGIRLNKISAKTRTHGAHEPIGTLYGFTLLIKTETELNNLERQIKLSLKPIEQTEGQPTSTVAENQLQPAPLKPTQWKHTVNG